MLQRLGFAYLGKGIPLSCLVPIRPATNFWSYKNLWSQ